MEFGHLEGIPQPDPYRDENDHRGYQPLKLIGMILRVDLDSSFCAANFSNTKK